MKNKMTLGKRIAFGIIVMLLLMVLVGSAGYYSLNRVLSVMEFSDTIQIFQNMASSIKEHTDQYQLSTYAAENDLRDSAREKAFLELEEGIDLIGRIKTFSLLGEEGRNQLSIAESEIANYRDDFNGLIGSIEKRGALDEQIRETGNQFSEGVKGQFLAGTLEMTSSIFISAYITYTNQNTEENWEQLITSASLLEKEMDAWYQKIESSEELNALSKRLKAYYQSIQMNLDAYHAQVINHLKFRAGMNSRKENLNKVAVALGTISSQRLQKQINFSLKIIIGFLAAGLLFGITYAIVSTRRIVGNIEKAIRGVATGAEQVDIYSRQVSEASHSLAEGSSEQAASIEETSASLEEMSSMTQSNADSALQADSVMHEVNQIVVRANESMAHLTNSIEDISRSSEKTSKIIKTIDEIAFQTNLLALNAAVEAARAGEAGAGFAVVADEVRNLSMRAADAAKNTADLLEGTVKKISEGSRLVTQTNDAFTAVAKSAGKVGDLVGEIAAASREQAQGIGQVNTAVMEMDKVIQQNAANSEESASGAEQMTAQAEKLKAIVQDLDAMVGGNRKQRKKDPATGTKSKRGSKKEPGTTHFAPSGSTPEFHTKDGNRLNGDYANEMGSEDHNPFNEDDFADF